MPPSKRIRTPRTITPHYVDGFDRSDPEWRTKWHLANEGRTKACTICGQILPVTEFYLLPKGRPISACNKCERERHRKRSHTPEHRAYQREWNHNNIEKSRARARKYHREHREEEIIYKRIYRKNNLEELRRKRREQMSTPHSLGLMRLAQHRRRQHNDYVLSAEQWKVVLDFFDGKCAYCGSSDRVEMDHFFPLSRGGLALMGNVIPACKSCNCSKNNTPPHEWLSPSDFNYFMTLLSSASR